jgi:hypothetical protein
MVRIRGTYVWRSSLGRLYGLRWLLLLQLL